MNKKVFLVGLAALAGVGIVVARRASAASVTTDPDSPNPLPTPIAKKALGEIAGKDPEPARGRSKLEQAADELYGHLIANPRKGTESKAMVASFERLAGLNDTRGLYGINDAQALANILGRAAPTPRYWPKGKPAPVGPVKPSAINPQSIPWLPYQAPGTPKLPVN